MSKMIYDPYYMADEKTFNLSFILRSKVLTLFDGFSVLQSFSTKILVKS